MFGRKLFLILALFAAASTAASSAASYTYVDLVKRLTDMEALAVLPAPGETCAQWSSWDRASVYDAASGKYVKWDANGDSNGMIRREGDGFVMAEMKGPGCIWRIWSAAPGDGHVRIYLDGAAEPAVDLPFKEYFDLSSKPFVYPSLVHTVSGGWNCYIPIPYRKSCKIVAGKGWGAYYHFTYSTFPEGTEVPTFTRDLSPEETSALDSADRFLRKSLGSNPAGDRAGELTETARMRVPAGDTATVAALTGERAITSIWVKVDPAVMEADPDILRKVVLRIRWDGEQKPSVWAPLGDFFGSGPGANDYRSLPLGMTDYGFYSYWYMPFEKQATIDLVNESRTPFQADFWVTHAPLTRPIEELARFHAKWHRDAFLPSEPERWIDWPMLKTTGRGRFCGVMLEVWNPRGGWWGEGDEKFFVDGEKFPSTFGTGSEDYFGYAWCNPKPFSNAYHNQTRNDGNNTGHVSVNRFQITDSVPFEKSFEGDIEKYYPNNRPTLYASTAYWYLEPGGTDAYTPVGVKDRTGFYVKPKPVPGVLEGEGLKVLGKTGGDVEKQDLGGDWSGSCQLWWIHAKPGDKLDLALPVKDKGRYTLAMRYTKAVDYGIVRFYIDGQELGDPVDLYSASLGRTKEIPYGPIDLTKGEHKLTVEITGANENAVKSFMFGLDYLKLHKS